MASHHVVHECATPDEVNQILTGHQHSEWASDELTVTKILSWPSREVWAEAQERDRARNQR